MNKRNVIALSLCLGLSFAAVAGVALSAGIDRIYGGEPSYIECGDIVFGTEKYEGGVLADDPNEGADFTTTFISVAGIEAEGAYASGRTAVRIGSDTEGGILRLSFDKSYRIEKVRVYCYADTTALFSLYTPNSAAIYETCDWQTVPDISGVEGEKSVYFSDLGGTDFEYSSGIEIKAMNGPLYVCKLVFTLVDGGSEPPVSTSTSSSSSSTSEGPSVDYGELLEGAVARFDESMGIEMDITQRASSGEYPLKATLNFEQGDLDSVNVDLSGLLSSGYSIESVDLDKTFYEGENKSAYYESIGLDGKVVAEVLSGQSANYQFSFFNPFRYVNEASFLSLGQDGTCELKPTIATAICDGFVEMFSAIYKGIYYKNFPQPDYGETHVYFYLNEGGYFEGFSAVFYFRDNLDLYVDGSFLPYDGEANAHLSSLPADMADDGLKKVLSLLGGTFMAYDDRSSTIWRVGEMTAHQENADYGEKYFYAPMENDGGSLYRFIYEDYRGGYFLEGSYYGTIEDFKLEASDINPAVFETVDDGHYRLSGDFAREFSTRLSDSIVYSGFLSSYSAAPCYDFVLMEDGFDLRFEENGQARVIRVRPFGGMPDHLPDGFFAGDDASLDEAEEALRALPSSHEPKVVDFIGEDGHAERLYQSESSILYCELDANGEPIEGTARMLARIPAGSYGNKGVDGWLYSNPSEEGREATFADTSNPGLDDFLASEDKTFSSLVDAVSRVDDSHFEIRGGASGFAFGYFPSYFSRQMEFPLMDSVTLESDCLDFYLEEDGTTRLLFSKAHEQGVEVEMRPYETMPFGLGSEIDWTAALPEGFPISFWNGWTGGALSFHFEANNGRSGEAYLTRNGFYLNEAGAEYAAAYSDMDGSYYYSKGESGEFSEPALLTEIGYENGTWAIDWLRKSPDGSYESDYVNYFSWSMNILLSTVFGHPNPEFGELLWNYDCQLLNMGETDGGSTATVINNANDSVIELTDMRPASEIPTTPFGDLSNPWEPTIA